MNQGKEAQGLIARYDHGDRRRWMLLLFSGIGVLLLAVWFSVLGTTDTSLRDVCGTLITLAGAKELDTAQKVILYLRLPRIAMAVIAGIGLSVSGAAMQGITRNPLVSPFTIGISNAAAFGASLAIVFGVGIFPHTQAGVILTAFLLAFCCAGMVGMVACRTGMRAETIVLAGISINYLFSAGTSVIQYFADEYRLSAAVAWAFGSLNGAEWGQVGLMAGIVGICFAAIYLRAPALDLVSAGDDETAASLGVHPAGLRVYIGFFSVLATAAVISFTGVIGFVGLAGPHIARMLIGGEHRFLLAGSALTGAALLLAADTIGRLLLTPVMLPVGIVISFLGVPVFVHLILRQRRAPQ